MKYRRFMLSILVFIVVAAGIIVHGCDDGSRKTEEPQERQSIEVKRGDLLTTISSFGNVSMPHQANLSFGIGGTIRQLNVEFGDMVKEGDVLATLDPSSLERAVARSEADLRTAQINLEKANSDISILQAQVALGNAQVNLASAEEALEQARSFNVSDAQTNLENALRDLATAQKNAEINIMDAEDAAEDAYDNYGNFVKANMGNLDKLHIKTQKEDLWWIYQKAVENLEITRQTAATTIAKSETNVTNAQNFLTNAPIDIQQKESTVASARAAVLRAENDLGNAEAGLDIEMLEIMVDKAQIALEEATDQLEKATLGAPFDGTIARVNVLAGDEVMPNTIIMYLVDTSEVEMDADVDEIDVAKVEIGQEAEIDIDAVPGTKFPGEVTAVSPVGMNQAGLITYDIAIGIKDTMGANLKDGMTASADVFAMLAENVILVPKAAIEKDRSTGIQTVAVVLDNGQEEIREVETGASNGKLTEIRSGLKEGEQIISSVNIAVSSSSSGSGDGKPEDVDIMECMSKLQDIMPCTEKLMEMGEEMGMAPGEYTDEIPWEEIEYWVNDDSGEVPRDVKDCLNKLLENRACLEALMQMAKDMGIDPSQYSGGNWGGMGGM